MFRRLALSLAVAAGLIVQFAASRFGDAWRRRVRGPRFAGRELAGRARAVRLGRQEFLLVQFGLARPGLVLVRLCLAARIWLGRPRRLARWNHRTGPPDDHVVHHHNRPVHRPGHNNRPNHNRPVHNRPGHNDGRTTTAPAITVQTTTGRTTTDRPHNRPGHGGLRPSPGGGNRGGGHNRPAAKSRRGQSGGGQRRS